MSLCIIVISMFLLYMYFLMSKQYMNNVFLKYECPNTSYGSKFLLNVPWNGLVTRITITQHQALSLLWFKL